MATSHELHLRCVPRPGATKSAPDPILSQVDSVILELSSKIVRLGNSRTGESWALTTGRRGTPSASDRLMLDELGGHIVGAGYQAAAPYAFVYERDTGLLTWSMIGAGPVAAQTWTFLCQPRG